MQKDLKYAFSAPFDFFSNMNGVTVITVECLKHLKYIGSAPYSYYLLTRACFLSVIWQAIETPRIHYFN